MQPERSAETKVATLLEIALPERRARFRTSSQRSNGASTVVYQPFLEALNNLPEPFATTRPRRQYLRLRSSAFPTRNAWTRADR